jgi:hypothetical protein
LAAPAAEADSALLGRGGQPLFKTDGMLGEFALHASEFGSDAIGMALRRERTQLVEMIERSKLIYGPIGAKYSEQAKMWRFPNGARLVFAYCENDSDAEVHQGKSFSRIYIEELGNFPNPIPVMKLIATLRSPNQKVKVGFRATANPGGPGHCISFGEVLTPHGWKDIRDFRVGDPVYTVTAQRSLVETHVDQVHCSDYSGDLIEIKTRGLHMEFTPEHSVAYIPGTKNAKPDLILAPFDELPGQAVIARQVSWNPSICLQDDHFIEIKCNLKRADQGVQPEGLLAGHLASLLGWYLSEGSVIKRDGKPAEGFHIAQIKPATREKLKIFLADTCGFQVSETDTGFSVFSQRWASIFEELGFQPKRYISRDFLDASREVQYALFEAMVDGDGHWSKYGKSGVYYTSSERLADDFQELVTKLGFLSYYGTRDRRGLKYICGKLTHVNHLSHEISFKTVKSGGTEILTGNHVYDVGTETKRRSDMSRKHFDGKVYCLGIRGTHTFLVRQNGSVWISGNSWIRSRYIDPAPKGMKIIRDTYKNPFTGKEIPIERVYIPSKVTDNKYCNTDQYIAQLQLSAGKRLLHAWLHGDWSIIEGAFFEEWDAEKHVIQPFVIPPHWTRFCSADWGSASPFAIHWWAVVPGDANDDSIFTSSGDGGYGGVQEKLRYRGDLPAGAMVCYREWYGSPNHSNTGLKLHAEEVARGIVERERYEPRNDMGRARISYRVMDPDACKDKGGPSIAERMGYAPNYVFWQPADNMRVGRRGFLGGWDALRARLKGDAHGRPMIYFFTNCEDVIRTLPVMQHDPDNVEDMMKQGEDHCFAGATLVTTPGGLRRIDSLPPSGIVLTKGGDWVPYRSARRTRRDAPMVRLTFSNGVSVKCTPDHRFLDASDTWRYASNLKGARIQCSQPLSAGQSKNSEASDTTYAENTSRIKESGFTLSSGNTITVQDLQATTSTTETRIEQTITRITLNALMNLRIMLSDMGAKSRDLFLRLLTPPRQLGMRRRKVNFGIRSTTSWIVRTSCTRKREGTVHIVGSNSKRLCGHKTDFAAMHVSQRIGVQAVWTTLTAFVRSAAARLELINIGSRERALKAAARRLAATHVVECLKVESASSEDAYCITVPSTECFALEGGIITSNCVDGVRYAAMSRPYTTNLERKQPDRIFAVGPGNQLTINDVMDDAPRRSTARYERIK